MKGLFFFVESHSFDFNQVIGFANDVPIEVCLLKYLLHLVGLDVGKLDHSGE